MQYATEDENPSLVSFILFIIRPNLLRLLNLLNRRDPCCCFEHEEVPLNQLENLVNKTINC